MPLHVLPQASIVSEATLLRLYNRALLHWLRHYGDENDIEIGVAIANADLPDIAEAHTILDAAVSPEVAGQAALGQIDAAFAPASASCPRIVANPDSAEALPADFRSLLLARGYVQDTVHVLALSQPPADLKQTHEGLTIIPARAGFRQAMELAHELVGRDATQAAESLQLHLDDPHYDAVIALAEGKAIAWAGVLAVGEVGLLRQVYVSPQYRGRGIGRVMLAHALDICERSAFRHVLAGVGAGNETLLRLLSHSGFRRIGQVRIFRHQDDELGEL